MGAADSLWYKDHGTEELMSVVKRTLAGEKVFPDIAPTIEMEGYDVRAFSPRQMNILRLYIKGFTYQEIADKLGISKNDAAGTWTIWWKRAALKAEKHWLQLPLKTSSW